MSFLPVYKKYRDDVEFMMVYIREAHSTDRWWLAETKFMRFVSVLSNDYPLYDIKEPKSIEERRVAATACRAKLLEDMPVYVDDMSNSVNQNYVGWPTRKYFLDKEGQVKYDSGLGPYGFSPDVFKDELSKYLNNK